RMAHATNLRSAMRTKKSTTIRVACALRTRNLQDVGCRGDIRSDAYRRRGQRDNRGEQAVEAFLRIDADERVGVAAECGVDLFPIAGRQDPLRERHYDLFFQSHVAGVETCVSLHAGHEILGLRLAAELQPD